MAERCYPKRGHVTVVSAEAQEWTFVRKKIARRSSPDSLLATSEPRWLGEDEAVVLVRDLTELITDDVGPDDRLDLRRAVALVQYGVDTGTGIQIMPPSG
jgi:hypothetical protein